MKIKNSQLIKVFLLTFVFFLLVGFKNDLHLEDINTIIYKSGTINYNETWVTGNIYVVNGDLTISSGIRVTVQKGVIIKVDSNKRIIVNGSIRFNGTTAQPIYVTSLKDDTVGGDTNGDGSASAPAPGDWAHIRYNNESVDSENIIDNAIMRFGGFYEYNYPDYYGVIRIYSASPTIKNSLITQNSGYAISASIDSFPIVQNNTLTLNGGNGIEIREGTLSTPSPIAYRWSNTSTAYAITGEITIGSGTTLIIDPGVVVKLDDNCRIIVDGALKVLGTSSQKINITSLKDDTVGGDTNGDGSASAPVPGDWGSIWYSDSSADSENIIDNTIIRFGGFYEHNYPDYYGVIRIYSASPTIKNNVISNNNIGISTVGQSNPTIQHNSIYLNENFGLKNEEATVNINAINNWWGHSSGPYNATSNPSGQGNAVSDHVIFSPWLHEPPF
jgi:parallel beta-helix repeat protein